MADIAIKHIGELLAEIDRLRTALQAIADGHPTVRPARTGQGDLDLAYDLEATAVAALKEPETGRPDCICRGED